MSEKKKIAIIDNSIDVTGALNAILNYVEFAKEHYSFIFLLPSGSRATEKVKARGYEVLEVPFLEINKNWKHMLLYLPRLTQNAFRLKKIVRKNNIALVHVNDFYNLVGVIAKILGGNFSLITHVRFMPDRFTPFLRTLWIKLHIKYANIIICVSYAVKRLLSDHAKIQVVYDSLNYHPSCTRIHQEKENINLLYLAHYIPGKGQNYALEAFKIAWEQNFKLRLKFVGGDMGMEKNKHFKETLICRAKILGLQDAVYFSGPVDDVQKELSIADIMLNFSESESFSMTCLEALSNGVPLIATDCGGPAELFVHGASGLLVPNRNIHSMCEAILQLSEDYKMREKFSMNSINYVGNKFSKINTLQTLVKLYHTILVC